MRLLDDSLIHFEKRNDGLIDLDFFFTSEDTINASVILLDNRSLTEISPRFKGRKHQRDTFLNFIDLVFSDIDKLDSVNHQFLIDFNKRSLIALNYTNYGGYRINGLNYAMYFRFVDGLVLYVLYPLPADKTIYDLWYLQDYLNRIQLINLSRQ
jgi:hypothetical protein